jgi:thioredoxin-related protein
MSQLSFAKDSHLPNWYDESRDPIVDLDYAVSIAKDRKILVIVGGDWCSWCHLLNKYFKTHDSIYQKLNETFVVLKVNYSDENKNETFFKNYPAVNGYPYFMILDKNKKYLGKQDTGKLEQGRGYSDSKMLAFINKWK